MEWLPLLLLASTSSPPFYDSRRTILCLKWEGLNEIVVYNLLLKLLLLLLLVVIVIVVCKGLTPYKRILKEFINFNRL